MTSITKDLDAMGNVLRRIARSPFFIGFARGMDLRGALNEPMPYERAEDPTETDARAMRSDWSAVGGDIIVAAERLEEEHAVR
jgi:hypothetical protein